MVIQTQETKVSALAKQLEATGPFADVEVETARQTGRDLLCWTERLTLAERCLREGDRWKSKADSERLTGQGQKVEQLEKAWSSLIQ